MAEDYNTLMTLTRDEAERVLGDVEQWLDGPGAGSGCVVALVYGAPDGSVAMHAGDPAQMLGAAFSLLGPIRDMAESIRNPENTMGVDSFLGFVPAAVKKVLEGEDPMELMEDWDHSPEHYPAGTDVPFSLDARDEAEFTDEGRSQMQSVMALSYHLSSKLEDVLSTYFMSWCVPGADAVQMIRGDLAQVVSMYLSCLQRIFEELAARTDGQGKEQLEKLFMELFMMGWRGACGSDIAEKAASSMHFPAGEETAQ